MITHVLETQAAQKPSIAEITLRRQFRGFDSPGFNGAAIDRSRKCTATQADLCSLKDTLQLDQLTSTTPEMVAKEIDVAMLAYNLVRAVICVAAQKAGLEPRRFSFTRVRNILNTFAPLIANARDGKQAQQLFDKMMYYVGQAKLPQRKRKRPSYPRAVWPKPYKYPKRKE